MSTKPRAPLPPIKRQRHDGWTLERQMLFLSELRRSRNVVRAAAAAGMNRKSAYRLRERPDGAEFAAAWVRTLSLSGRIAAPRKSHSESHTRRQKPPRSGALAPSGKPRKPQPGAIRAAPSRLSTSRPDRR